MDSFQAQFEQAGPWITRFWVDGVPCGGSKYDPSNDDRIAMFEAKTGPLAGKRILELGPLEGGHTLKLARRGASVVAIEGHEASYQRCLFVKDFFNLQNVEFILGDLRTFELRALGPFDYIYNIGVLYHFDEPWKLLMALRGAAPSMFLSTHCSRPEVNDAEIQLHGIRLTGSWWQEGGADEPLSGLQPRSFWPARKSLERMLRLCGWSRIDWIEYKPEAHNGPVAALWVERGPCLLAAYAALCRAARKLSGMQ